jgi:pectate lyase
VGNLTLLGVGGGGAAAPSGPITDDFNRADLGSGWTSLTGNWLIVSNTARPAIWSDRSIMCRSEASFPANQYAQVQTECVYSGDNILGGVAVRVQDALNYYAGFLQGADPTISYVALYKMVAGVWGWVSDAAFAGTFGTLYTLKLEVAGSLLTLSVDGVQKLQETDTDLSTGKPGIYQSVTYGISARADNFECTAAS